MIDKASDTQLKDAFQSHYKETELHVTRLNQLISELNQGDVDDKKDPITAALIGAAENIVSESESGPVRDAGLLASAQKIEHYEIASYGSARDWAQALRLPRHAQLLQETLDEEKHADQLLTTISQRANTTAAGA